MRWMILAGMLLPTVAGAEFVSPPLKDGYESACRVSNLDPQGDGFLAVREGPSTKYRQIGALYNGDVVNMQRPCRGNWCFADQVYRNNQEVRLIGWFYSGFCPIFAG